MEIRRLNTLRGLAALIVVVSHYSNLSGFWNKALGAGAGQMGVMIFFLLSGFLMSYLYLAKTPDRRNMRAFLVARIARVIPLYLVVVIASFLISHLASKPYRNLLYGIDKPSELVAHLLFLRGESVLWTIPAEIHFYALFALAWFFYHRFRASLCVVAALLLVADFFWGFQDGKAALAGMKIVFGLPKALPYFVCGTILGQIYRDFKPPRTAMSNYYLLSLILVLLLYPNIFSLITGRKHEMWSDAGVLVLLSGVFFAVVFLVPDNNLLLENPIGDFLGKVSYSLYLLHLPVLTILENLGLIKGVWPLGLFLLLSCIVAYVSFILIEAPSRAFIRDASARRASPVPTAS